MSRGIVTTAVNLEQMKQATALAYSVKIHNNVDVTVIVSDLDMVEKHQEEPFDSIIEFPYKTTTELRSNDWQLYYCSPYDYTVFLDCRQLVNINLDTTWDLLCDHYDLFFSTHARDFRYSALTNADVYDKYAHRRIYANAFYFKKDTETAQDFFKFMDPVLRNWQEALNKLLEPHDVPVWMDIDLIYSVIVHNLDIAFDTTLNTEVFQTVDLKLSEYMFANKIDKSYTEYLNIWPTTRANVKIQNYKVSGILNYQDSDFLTQEVYDANRDTYREQTKILG